MAKMNTVAVHCAIQSMLNMVTHTHTKTKVPSQVPHGSQNSRRSSDSSAPARGAAFIVWDGPRAPIPEPERGQLTAPAEVHDGEQRQRGGAADAGDEHPNKQLMNSFIPLIG